MIEHLEFEEGVLVCDFDLLSDEAGENEGMPCGVCFKSIKYKGEEVIELANDAVKRELAEQIRFSIADREFMEFGVDGMPF